MVISKENTIKYLIFLLGASAAFGELANNFLPFASLMFVFLGFIIILYSALFYRKKSIKSRENRLIIASILFYVVYQIIYASKHSANGEGIISFFKIPIFLLIAFFVIKFCVYEKANLEYLLLGFIFGFLVAIPMGSIKMFAVSRMCGTYSNPNTYAKDCALFVYSSLYFLFAKRKIRYFLLTILGMIMVFLTGSRGTLLAVAIGLALLILDCKKITLKNVLLAFSGIIAVIVLLLFADQIPLLQRIFKSEYSDNIRLEIWKAYITNMRVFFWTGIDETKMESIHHFSTHNSILGPFVRYGIMGLLLYLTLDFGVFVSSMKNIINEKLNETKVAFCAYISFFLSGFTTENSQTRSKYIFMIVAITVLLRKKDDFLYTSLWDIEQKRS